MANMANTKEKVAARRAARKSSGMSAQKFYVTTRMAEAAKRGKTVDRAALRKKFQSGDVARKGFAAPKKKTGGTGSSSKVTGTGSTGSTGTLPKAFPDLKVDVAVLKNTGAKRTATQNMKGAKGFSAGKVTKSTKTPTTDSSSRMGYKSPGTKKTVYVGGRLSADAQPGAPKKKTTSSGGAKTAKNKAAYVGGRLSADAQPNPPKKKTTSSGGKTTSSGGAKSSAKQSLQDKKIAMLRAQPQGTLRDNKLREQMVLKKKIALGK